MIYVNALPVKSRYGKAIVLLSDPRRSMTMSKILGGLTILGVVLASSGNSANATANRTWHFPKDVMMTNNQISFDQGADGVWYFMQNKESALHNPLAYQFMKNYEALWPQVGGDPQPIGFLCWGDLQGPSHTPHVCINFLNEPLQTLPDGYTMPPLTASLAPTPDTSSIVAWRSPLAGSVRVSGVFGDIDPACGNGIVWSIDKGSKLLKSGTLANGAQEQVFDIPMIYVKRNTVLYFTVSANGAYECDSTKLDVTITVTP